MKALGDKKNAPVSAGAFGRSGGEQFVSRLVIVCHQQQDGGAPLFQKSLFQFGDLGGTVVAVRADLRGYIQIQGVDCGLGCSLVGKGEQSQLLAGGTGGSVNGCGGELFRVEIGFVQTVQRLDDICVQLLQRFRKGVRIQKCPGQILREWGLVLLQRAGGQGQAQAKE